MLNEYSEFRDTAKNISKNDDGNPLVNSKGELYNLDKIAISLKINKYKTPDAISIKSKKNKDIIFLIEFKGGDKILNCKTKTKKQEVKDHVSKKEYEKAHEKYKEIHKFLELTSSLKLKFLESILYVLPKVFKMSKSEILNTFEIYYIVVLSDEIDLNKSSNIHRYRFTYLSKYNIKPKFDLDKYIEEGSIKIIVENTDFFDKHIIKHLKL